MNQEIDDSIFESTNKKIKEFNLKNSEKLDIINDHFDEIKKGELKTKLIQEKNKLNQMIDNFENKLIPELPNWLEKSEKYFNDKITWENLNNKLNDYMKLFHTNKDMKIINNQIDNSNKKKEKLQYLTKVYPQYEIIKSEIDKINVLIKNLNEARFKDEKDVDALIIKHNEVSIEIEKREKEKKQIDELLINIPTIYENIEKLQKHISNMQTFTNSLLKIQYIKEAIENNIFIDIRANERYKLKVKNIEVLIKENILNKEKLTSLQHKKNQHQEYNRELRNLLSLGIQIIDKTQKDICPLCNTKQDNYDVLKNKVLNNPLLNTLEKELLEEEEKIQHIININNKKIEEEKNFIISELDEEVHTIKNNIDTLNYHIKSTYPNKVEIDTDTMLSNLLRQTEAMSKNELIKVKTKIQSELQSLLLKLTDKKNNLNFQIKEKKDNILLIDKTLEIYNKNLETSQDKEEYVAIFNFMSRFEAQINVLETIKSNIEIIDTNIKSMRIRFNKLNNEKLHIVNKYVIEHLDNLNKEIDLMNEKISELYTKNILIFELSYEEFFKYKINDLDKVKKDIKAKKIELDTQLLNYKKVVNLIEIIEKNIDNLLKFIQNKKIKKELKQYQKKHIVKIKVREELSTEKMNLEDKINKYVQEFFHEELINKIYEKIDPHPDYKKVKFECHFENSKGKLNVFVDNDKDTEYISPALYYSTAQLNVLSLSIFLAKALQTKDDEGNDVDCIFIDDPIQSMDSINVLATIDLLRSFVVNHNKQIILSTHDENFHYLLQKKMPTEYFNSKFIELETYGKVKK